MVSVARSSLGFRVATVVQADSRKTLVVRVTGGICCTRSRCQQCVARSDSLCQQFRST